MTTIVLDPGHGGDAAVGRSTPNRATGPRGLEERHLALDVVRRIQRHLAADPLHVVLTRDRDRNLSLRDRAEIARRADAAAFVSVHFGADRPQGVVTCVHERATLDDRAFGASMQRALVRASGLDDAGVRAEPLSVLSPDVHARGTRCLLVEPCVLDADAEHRLAEPAYRERLAGAIARVLRVEIGPQREPSARPSGRSAVVVGIDAYAEPLQHAVDDARWAAGWLRRALGVGRIAEIHDADATAERLLVAIRDAAVGASEVVLWFSGRGGASAQRPALRLVDGWIDGADLRAAAGATPLVVLADAGFADRGMRSAGVPDRPIRDGGVPWIAAAAPGMDAIEDPAIGHGLFTSALAGRFGADAHITAARLCELAAEDLGDVALRTGSASPARPWCSHPGFALGASPERPPPQALQALRHFVPLVPQTTDMSCWAAAAAMIVGWRERQSVADDGIAAQAGISDSFANGLRPNDTETLAASHGLVSVPARDYTPAELHAVLVRYGPLWVGEADPDLHVVVVAGMWGDGTLDGTEVAISDPWPVGKGERYTLSFRELMSNLHAATQRVGVHVQILHANGRLSGATTPEEPHAHPDR